MAEKSAFCRQPGKIHSAGVLVSCLVLTASAQLINITGTVTDSVTALPIAAAKIRLTDIPALTTTTDSSGKFALIEQATGLLSGSSSSVSPPAISAHGKAISLTGIDRAATATLEVYNARGVQVYRSQKQSANGSRIEFMCPSQLSGFQYITISAGDTRFALKGIGPDLQISRNSMASAGPGQRPLKKLDAHTIEVCKPGYLIKQTMVTGEIADVGTIMLCFPPNRLKEIPAGTFTMGQASIADTVHQVTLSAFAMQETDVTQQQYFDVMGAQPSYFTGDPARPVESITWFNAARYCNVLSALVGFGAVYDTTSWSADFSRNGFRLPTEAQWECACRAGTTTPYWWGNDTTGMDSGTWSVYNSDSMTHPVAAKRPNAFGLYDMTGNVWQWCNDWYATYGSDSVTDPSGPATGTLRVLRGGSWGYDDFRSATRDASDPNAFDNKDGFRCVLPR